MGGTLLNIMYVLPPLTKATLNESPRIVDAGSGPWDHINIDHIKLSWSKIGGMIDYSGEYKQYMLQEGKFPKVMT